MKRIKNNLLFLFIFLNSCNSNKNISAVYTTQNCTKKFTAVRLTDIINSVSLYDGRFVEISGYYNSSIEAAVIAIYPIGYRNSSENVLWVDFDYDIHMTKGNDTTFLFKPFTNSEKVREKKVKIRGTIEGRKYKGYAGKIKDVCYLEVLR